MALTWDSPVNETYLEGNQVEALAQEVVEGLSKKKS